MKIDKILVKTALTAFVAFGAVAETANATQIHADYGAMTQQEAKRAASVLRAQIDCAELAKTDTLEMFHAAKAGNLDQFARDFAKSAALAIKHYVNHNLIAGNNATVLLTKKAANRANAAGNGDVYALVTNVPDPGKAGGGRIAAAYNAGGGWGQTVGGAGGGHAAGAGLTANDMPADLTKKGFFDALQNRMNTVAVAELHELAIVGAGDFLMPAHFTSDRIMDVKDAIKDALKAELARWLRRMETGGNAIFVPGAVGVVGLLNPNLAGAGAGAPGMFARAGAIVAPARPANGLAVTLAAAFDAVLDEVDKF